MHDAPRGLSESPRCSRPEHPRHQFAVTSCVASSPGCRHETERPEPRPVVDGPLGRSRGQRPERRHLDHGAIAQHGRDRGDTAIRKDDLRDRLATVGGSPGGPHGHRAQLRAKPRRFQIEAPELSDTRLRKSGAWSGRWRRQARNLSRRSSSHDSRPTQRLFAFHAPGGRGRFHAAPALASGGRRASPCTRHGLDGTLADRTMNS